MTLEVVLLGTGMMGRIVAPIIRQAGGEVVAVAGSSIEKARAFVTESKLPRVKAYGTLIDYEHLFELGNTVAVLTPNSFHIPQASAAVKAGKHVLVEKPLGVNLEECYAFRDAALEAGVAVEVNSQYRHTEVLGVLRNRIGETRPGEKILLFKKYIQDWQENLEQSIGWRPIVEIAGKGKLTGDLGVHVIQTTLDLFVGKFIEFNGQTYNVHPVRYEFIGNVGAFGGGSVPTYKEQPNLYEKRDMLSDKFSGDDIATASFKLEAYTGAIVEGRYVLSQVTSGNDGNANNFTIEAIFENGDRYSWSEENPNHLDYTNELGTYERIQRSSSPSISGRPGGHPKGYGDAILDELLKMDAVIESKDSTRIKEYTMRNLDQACSAMGLIHEWNRKPLLSWVGAY